MKKNKKISSPYTKLDEKNKINKLDEVVNIEATLNTDIVKNQKK